MIYFVTLNLYFVIKLLKRFMKNVFGHVHEYLIVELATLKIIKMWARLYSKNDTANFALNDSFKQTR